MTWSPDGIEADPLALADRYHHHVDGAFIPKGDGKALHMLVKFPSSVPVATREDAAAALALTVDFARSIFGDEAVFAARMDRDEKSLTNADLFIAPRYLKKTKHSEKIAVSLSRDLKRMAERRGGLRNDHTILAAQGTALQDDFATFLRARGYQALRGQPKQVKGDDWLSPEAYGVATDREIVEAGQEANRIDEEDLARERAAFEESSRQQRAALQAMTEEAAAQAAEADQMFVDAARARVEGEQLLNDARLEEARVASLAKAVTDAAADQARQDEQLRAREERCRQEEERIAAETQDIVKARDAMRAQATALGRRGLEASAREEAADDREAGLARIAVGVADQAQAIDKNRAEAIVMSVEAERTADVLKQAAAADRDRARLSVMAGLIADEQIALIARAADDEGLELRLTDDERGVSMNEAAMNSAERDTYHQPWSKMARNIAQAVAIMLSQLRDRLAAILTAQRKAETDIAKLTEEKKAIASERQTLKADTDRVRGDLFLAKTVNTKAHRFLASANEAAKAWHDIPVDRRSPEVLDAVRRTGIARQAAALAAVGPVAAQKPIGPVTPAMPIDRQIER